MSSRERKATDSAGMRPRLDPNLTSDDTQNPDAITPVDKGVIDVSSEDITSSGKEGQQARKEIQDLFEESEEPIKNFLQGNRERFTAIIMASFETMEQKVEDVLKIQCEQRQKLYQDYSLQIMNLNRKLSMDADQVKKQAEKLSNMFKEQRKFIHQSLILQKKRMEGFKSLCEQYLEKLEVLRDSRGNSVAEELRHLIATLEIKLLMVNRQQESAAAQQSLLDLLFS
ncbi:X-linked lymphocyte-regulated protein 3A-like isoform X1 [Peromyscus eremicus]|uniref:X-linked lymphocyte-regulated protein 3A-like isoform X2 n=1 Tax=Peromyscus eremicus TaxID=42410 RepID=UPI0027DD9564|nr:X-linked lymphocyte-regulated protein 3A-like isoform X2 [Peromyscus eremicus]XP_059109026.1 X-linked lymphocyte-regulated protein 3A-like isoform X1 [Peromyscus eremicus]